MILGPTSKSEAVILRFYNIYSEFSINYIHTHTAPILNGPSPTKYFMPLHQDNPTNSYKLGQFCISIPLLYISGKCVCGWQGLIMRFASLADKPWDSKFKDRLPLRVQSFYLTEGEFRPSPARQMMSLLICD